VFSELVGGGYPNLRWNSFSLRDWPDYSSGTASRISPDARE
jgi:hypothetical protein